MTFDAEYFEANESWAAEMDGQPVAFYTLLDKDGTVWLENLWVMPEYMGRGIGRSYFTTAWNWLATAVSNYFSWKPIPTQLASMRKWECTKLPNENMK